MTSDKDRVSELLKKRANSFSSMAGISRVKSYGIIGQAMPHIESTQILQNPRSSKKRILVKWVQEFEL